MKVELLHSSPLWTAGRAIRKCWASEGKSDTEFVEFEGELYYGVDTECGEKDKELIHRVGNKFKHASTLEHLVYSFDIDGISRACLQEVARHRIASYSVKSTRYTLKELKDEERLADSFIAGWKWGTIKKYCVLTNNKEVDCHIARALAYLKESIELGISNDIAKYCLPEAYKTSLVMTINARSLQNFLSLRTSKSALWEIRDLANAMYEALPEEHTYLFEDCVGET